MESRSFYHRIDEETKRQLSTSFLKPVHEYAYKISPMPEQIAPNIFRQYTYSEYLIQFKENDTIYMVSRPAIPQFIKIDDIAEKSDFFFSTLFEFYVSWWIDTDKDVTIATPLQDDCAFLIPDGIKVNFKNFYKEPYNDLAPIHIPFFVKKESNFIKPEYGKVLKKSIAYDMIIGE